MAVDLKSSLSLKDVCVNGEQDDWIHYTSSLHHRDPPFPHLCIFAVGSLGLSKLLNQATVSNFLEGLGILGFDGVFTILQYENDVLIFIKARKEFAIVLKLILYNPSSSSA